MDLHVPLILMPRDPIDSDSRPLLQIEERFGQTVFVDMMQQGSELERAAGAGRFTHAVQTA